ncbi:MAG: hypothetical protein HFACDABA_02250 [Anaerolineales bacterium]|nr:hypothetical protein [Anaerolineales bacterium]
MKRKNEPRRFESETLGLPPLKMVLFNADALRREGQKKTRALRDLGKTAKYRAAVEKLIKHLKDSER